MATPMGGGTQGQVNRTHKGTADRPGQKGHEREPLQVMLIPPKGWHTASLLISAQGKKKNRAGDENKHGPVSNGTKRLLVPVRPNILVGPG